MSDPARSHAAVAAVAGRRIDAPDTMPPRFPLGAIPLVRQRLAALLVEERVSALVASAACGADLIALEEAARLGIRRRIVLPFPVDRFRTVSVTDRPGDWGPLFDRLVAEAAAGGDLIILPAGGGTNDDAYDEATRVIVAEAQGLARTLLPPRRCLGITVWEGARRAGTDASGGFRERAAAAGFEERIILTV